MSLGFDKKLFKDRHSRDIWLDVELGVDWNNRNHRYYRQDGDTLWTPLFDDSGKTETVEKLGTIIDKGERFATTTYRPAEPEPAPRPV